MMTALRADSAAYDTILDLLETRNTALRLTRVAEARQAAALARGAGEGEQWSCRYHVMDVRALADLSLALLEGAIDDLAARMELATAIAARGQAAALARLQATHRQRCDEGCAGCLSCYRATGDTTCDRLCEHATLADYE